MIIGEFPSAICQPVPERTWRPCFPSCYENKLEKKKKKGKKEENWLLLSEADAHKGVDRSVLRTRIKRKSLTEAVFIIRNYLVPAYLN